MPTATGWLTRLAVVAVTSVATFALGAGALAGAHQLRYRGRIFHGVSVWGIDLSGQTPLQAASSLSLRFQYPNQPAFQLDDGDRTWTATPAELGVAFDLPATVAGAYGVGRSGDWTSDLADQFRAWHAGRSMSPVVLYNAGRAQAYLQNIALEIHRSPIEARLGVNGLEVTVESGQVGRELNVAGTLARLDDPIRKLSSAEIPLAVEETPPAVLDASAQAKLAQEILSEPLVLSVDKADGGDAEPWTFEPDTLAGMLVVRRVEDEAGARYEVGLNQDQLTAFVESLASALHRKAENPRFIFNDDTRLLDLVRPGQVGRTLDVPASVAAINERLAAGQHDVALVFSRQLPEVPDSATAADLGITEAVSVQSTYFAGSSPERVQNIRTAAAQFHGVLVPPGATFSAVDALGDVSLDNGYAEAWIIYAGRTIKGVGGGVCQVSTTLFRAAFFGGYPIAERYAHAYRVGYYERGFGPGLDATVFVPLVDFKFVNDSPNWLLMETYLYPGEMRLEWKFYSTSDGRTVEVGRPVISNVVPHPEPVYEENPDLPPGIENMKQVDWAADGADVVVVRTVRRPDGASDEYVVRTHYLPWRAVYQYGPGTEVPTPEATLAA